MDADEKANAGAPNEGSDPRDGQEVPRRGRDEPLEAWIKRIPPHQWVSIPSDSLSREDLRVLFGPPDRRIFQAFQRGSDRDLALICGSVLERVLADLLCAFVQEAAVATLFGDNGMRGRIQDFHARIELAFGLGLVSAKERTLLNTIREIRNAFAHDHEIRAFGTDEKVLGLARSIPMAAPSGLVVPPRDRVAFTSIAMYKAFVARLGDPALARRQPFVSIAFP